MRCRVGVQRIGLSFGSASLTVGAVNLHHGDACGAQLPSQARSVGPGPLHADPLKMAIRLQPAHKCSVAGRGRGKLSIAELTPHGVQRRGVVGLPVGSTAPVTSAVVVVMLVMAVLLPFVRIGRHAAVGRADKPVMGASAQAPMRSRHPKRACETTPPTGSTDPAKDTKITSGIRRIRPSRWCLVHPHWHMGTGPSRFRLKDRAPGTNLGLQFR